MRQVRLRGGSKESGLGMTWQEATAIFEKAVMNERERLDFLAAFGDEFCHALADSVGLDAVVPQDGYGVFLRVFQQEPSPKFLSSLSND
jgi:hypothetical protein